MTSPISPHRLDPWTPTPDVGPSAPPTKYSAAAREIPELPDTTATAIANAVQAARAGTAKPLLGMGIDASIIQTSRDTLIEQRLDAFRTSAIPTYHTPHEGDVQVAIPFRMTQPAGLTSDSVYGQVEGRVQDNAEDLKAIAGQIGLGGCLGSLYGGRATPDQIHRVTQALIDARRLPPPDGKTDLPTRVRTMMCNYGIGLDCAGYAQQAFLASRHLIRSQTQLRDPSIEDLSSLTRYGFVHVAASDARAGDLIVLKANERGQPGHTAIVREAYYATADDVKSLVKRDFMRSGANKLDVAHLKTLVLDSSWGSSGKAQEGGVDRHTWWHDETNDKWVTEVPEGILVLDAPYDGRHTLDGIYRPAAER
jgi:hypothetical protein